MDRYWRLGILALVAFLLGTATIVAAPAFKAGPGGAPAPTLFTLLDRMQLTSGQNVTLGYVNVEGFSDYKVFIRRDMGTKVAGKIDVSWFESVDGVERALNWSVNTNASTDHDVPADFIGTLPSLPFRHLQSEVLNDSPETQMVSLFLYAVP